MEAKIRERINQGIREKVFPGCVVGIIDSNGNKQIFAEGNFTYELDASKIQEDSIFDVASITKSIPTASIALQLIEEKKLFLEDLYTKHVLEFDNNYKDELKIKHLLTYSIPGYGLASIKEIGGEGILNTLMTKDFESAPGSVFQYTNIPAALMGIAIERIEGKKLDEISNERFFKPLGMESTSYSPEELPFEKIVPTEVDDWRGEVRGEVHDESAYLIKKELGRPVGHAGIFSSTGDLLAFAQMLLGGGVYKEKRFFQKETVTLMHTNQLAEIGKCTGLGWELNQPRYMGEYASKNTFGKTGFTGVRIIIDPEKGVAFTILSNRIYPKRPKDSKEMNLFTADIANIILKNYGA